MKLYNIKAIVPAAALALAFSMTSCMKDLEDGNINPKVEADVNVQGLYNKCYAGLVMSGNSVDGADFSIDDAGKSTLIRNIFNFNELSTDEFICWWSDGGIVEIGKNQYAPGHATLKFLYYRLMSNITYCNQFLSDDVSATTRQKAEVKVLRAYQYYLMLDFFGDCPFVEKIQNDAPLQAHSEYEKANSLPATTDRKVMLDEGRKYMFAWVEKELIEALAMDGGNALREADPRTSSQEGYGTVDKAVAWLLLSRLYLNAGVYLGVTGSTLENYYAQAKTYAEYVINSNYALFDSSKESAQAIANGYKPYDLLFMGDNGENGSSCEAILPIIQQGNYTSGVQAGYATRSYGGSQFFIGALWNSDMLTVTNKSQGNSAAWSGMRLRPEFVEKFTANASDFEGLSAKQIRALNIDDRALICGAKATITTSPVDTTWTSRSADLGENDSFDTGLPSCKWNNNYSTGAKASDNEWADTDYFLFRKAEAYFNWVEADMYLQGCTYDNNKSVTGEDVNKMNLIRSRASATPYDNSTNKLTLKELLNEKGREFYGEGLRRTDLIRMGQYGGLNADYKWSYKGGQKAGVNFDSYRNVYPLPTSEISANSNLTQIYGY